MKRKIEYKKIALAVIVLFAIFYIVAGRVLAVFDIVVDSASDVALIYTILGSYVAYCTASATDKRHIAKYGDFTKKDMPVKGEEYSEGDENE